MKVDGPRNLSDRLRDTMARLPGGRPVVLKIAKEGIEAKIEADLAILGADPSDYDAYVNGVRAEYAHVPDAAWRTGRSAVLEGLLASPTLTARARASPASR